jgi:hypothetical protein
LKIAFDFDTLISRGLPEPQVLSQLQSRTGCSDPQLLAALAARFEQEQKPEV